MKFAKTLCPVMDGLKLQIIDVEVTICPGLPGFTIVGLPDPAVRESRERVRSAILGSGFKFPQGRLTVNLAPACLKKQGPIFDLAIAAGLLIASEQVTFSRSIDKVLLLGELSLKGLVRPTRTALGVVLTLSESNSLLQLLLSKSQSHAIYQSTGLATLQISRLKDLADTTKIFQHFKPSNLPCTPNPVLETVIPKKHDFSEIHGNSSAIRAMEIAAMGFHNLLLFGPPGSGKTI